jgi:fermentation-respiration switch protein FrsA (DUF1100 family)
MRYLIVLLAICLSGCLRLDDNLLSPGDKISEYKLDDYTGEVDFRLPDSMHIAQFTGIELISGGHKIRAFYLGDTARIGMDTVIVYCHGYNHHMDFYWPRASLLANVGGKQRFGVMMLDYRGYGLSEGEPSEEGLHEDVDAAVAWLKARGLRGERLAMYGMSLGGVPGVELTARPRSLTPAWLITENVFASPELLAQDAMQFAVPGSYFTNIKGDNAERIKHVEQPYLNLHGDRDAFIKFETHAVELRENYDGRHLVSITVKGADHDDLPVVMGFSEYLRALEEFLTTPN